MDASQSSMVALDASTIGTDISLPRRRRKRRRTIIDQLQHINISNGEVGVPNQILERAVAAGDDNSQTLTSSSGESDDEGGGRDDRSQIIPPSDVEIAQRTTMRELVFGRRPDPASLDPVERKIQALVRQSLEAVKGGQHPLAVFEPNAISESQDDMTIEPVYTRPSDPGFFNAFPTAGVASIAASASSATAGRTMMPAPPQLPPQRKRSNSLPAGLMDDLEAAPMEMS